MRDASESSVVSEFESESISQLATDTAAHIEQETNHNHNHDRDCDGDFEVAVIGAGAIGVTAAYDLARQGAAVTLYERDTVASASSSRAAGVCYDAFADELDATIGRESIERFRTLSGDDTFPFVECPYVWAAQDGDDDAEAISEQVRRMQANGIIAVEMDGNSLGERFPALRTDDIAVAGVSGGAGYIDPVAYTACLAAAGTGVGVTLETETPVEVGVEPPQIHHRQSGECLEFDAILVAAGAHTKQLLAAAGLSIAMKPYRVQAVTAAVETGSQPPFEGPMYYDATDGFYLRPHSDGLLAGDGLERREADPDNWNREPTDGFASGLLENVSGRVGPNWELERESAWAGLCTATPDRDPLVGELADGVYVATGFHGEGVMRAPALGERIATEILGGEGIDAFDPTRFAGEEAFEITDGLLD